MEMHRYFGHLTYIFYYIYTYVHTITISVVHMWTVIIKNHTFK